MVASVIDRQWRGGHSELASIAPGYAPHSSHSPLEEDWPRVGPMAALCLGPSVSHLGEALVSRLGSAELAPFRSYAAVLERRLDGAWRDLSPNPGAPADDVLSSAMVRLRAGGAARFRARQANVRVDTNALAVWYFGHIADSLPVSQRCEVRDTLNSWRQRPEYEVLTLLWPLGAVPSQDLWESLALWSAVGPLSICVMTGQDARGTWLEDPEDLDYQVAALVAACWAAGGAAQHAWRPLFQGGSPNRIVSAGIARRCVDRDFVRRLHVGSAIDAWLTQGLLNPTPPTEAVVSGTALAASDVVTAAEAAAGEDVNRLILTFHTELDSLYGAVEGCLAHPTDQSAWRVAETAHRALLDERLEATVEHAQEACQRRMEEQQGSLAALTGVFAHAMTGPGANLAALRAAARRASAELSAKVMAPMSGPTRSDVDGAWELLRRAATKQHAAWWLIWFWYASLAFLSGQATALALPNPSTLSALAIPGGLLHSPSPAVAQALGATLPAIVGGVLLLLGTVRLASGRHHRTAEMLRRRAALVETMRRYAELRANQIKELTLTLLYGRAMAIAATLGALEDRLTTQWVQRHDEYLTTARDFRSSREYVTPVEGMPLPDQVAPAPPDPATLEAITAAAYDDGTPLDWIGVEDPAAELVQRLFNAVPSLVTDRVDQLLVQDLVADGALPLADAMVEDAAALYFARPGQAVPTTHQLLLSGPEAPLLGGDLTAHAGVIVRSLEREVVSLVSIVEGIDLEARCRPAAELLSNLVNRTE